MAVERIQAAVEAARKFDFFFTLTARAENYLVGIHNLDDTIKRLQAYQEASADVLYAPGLSTKDDIAAVIAAVNHPVNILMGAQGATTVAALSALGVKRISTGSALSRAAYGAFLHAAREMSEQGTFAFADEAVSFREISAMLQD